MWRADATLGLLLFVACNPHGPEAAMPANTAPPVLPASSSQAPSPAVVVEPPPVKLSATEQAAVDAACKRACDNPPCTCDATRPLPGFLLTHLFDGDSHAWYVVQHRPSGHVLLTQTYEHSDAGHWSESTDPDRVCFVPRVGSGPLPTNVGVIRVEHPDLNLDGRDDLLLECSQDGGDNRYLRYCLSSDQFCAKRLQLREVRDGMVLVDVDVEFRHGWFVRTIRADAMGRNQGNVQVHGVESPDPRP